MKIGILTYHRSHNYGALLQAVALRKVLVDMGHQVTFIDYWPAYHRHMYAAFSIQKMLLLGGLRKQLSYLKSSLINHKVRQKRILNFKDFISHNIEPYISSMDEEYDLIVHGSDQIWRKQPEINKYNPFYFGKHQIRAKKKVSYAASMGVLADSESDNHIIKEYLSNLDFISVRERELFDRVRSMGFLEARQDLDPTLLLTSDEWIKMFNLQNQDLGEKYALYYMIMDSFDINTLERFTLSKGLKLKIIHSKATGQDTDCQISTADPRQFLELIYNADFVFTSSFHGLAFSLLFHKQFLASFTKNAGRAGSLLSSLDLSDHLILPKLEISTTTNTIDYDRVDKMLLQKRKTSMSYLNQIAPKDKISL